MTPPRPLRWPFLGRIASDIMVFARLDPSGQVIEYLLLPMFNVEHVPLSPRDEAAINRFRFDKALPTNTP